MFKDATFKARAVTAALTLLGIWYAPGALADGPTGAAMLVSYALLMAHTFLSIRCFGRISVSPLHTRIQAVIDTLLIFSYAAVAFNFPSPLWFAYFSVVLFAIAIVKYIHLWLVIQHSAFKELLLRKMVRADALGMGVSLAVFLGVAGGHPFLSFSLGAAVFTLSSIYYFFIKPLYPIIYE